LHFGYFSEAVQLIHLVSNNTPVVIIIIVCLICILVKCNFEITFFFVGYRPRRPREEYHYTNNEVRKILPNISLERNIYNQKEYNRH
jgi:hypothetical protein